MSEQWTDETRKKWEQLAKDPGLYVPIKRSTLGAALAELTRLREENERLRGALDRLVRQCESVAEEARRSFCPACYERKVYCRRCRTVHCQCSWNRCPKEKP